jgi:Domain of unknown function (DUF4434)
MSLRSFLTVVPPAPVTNKIKLDVRGAVQNSSISNKKVSLELLCNDQVIATTPETLLLSGELAEINYTLTTTGLIAENSIELRVNEAGKVSSELQSFTVVESDTKSSKLISGTWNSFYHWSESEGKHWNKDIKTLSAEDWRTHIQGMHKLGMDTVVIQELFRNQVYYGEHQNSKGYSGTAFYPSIFSNGRVDIACDDPLEVILSEADRLEMKIFVGVGLYAWFDFSIDSLKWHIKIADELQEMYGHHSSFYGWYISEEIFGDLGNDPKREDEIVNFFQKFKIHCKELSPTKPIMLAPNCNFILRAENGWKRLLPHLDILCPFGFQRMSEKDISQIEAANLFQKWCDETGTHLWMDMEVFDFDPDKALIPRKIEAIKEELNTLTDFEKTICFQYTGMMADPAEKITLGGSKAINLFKDYQKYFTSSFAE